MKTKQRAVFGLWSDVRISDLNRLLKPYGVRLVLKSSRDWGDQVSVTAHPVIGDRDPMATVVSPNKVRS